jgi:hypothetical protein
MSQIERGREQQEAGQAWRTRARGKDPAVTDHGPVGGPVVLAVLTLWREA